MYTGLKMLETIIDFSIWVYFCEHSQFARTTGKGGGYLFNSSWGPNFFGQRIYGEVILSANSNYKIIPRWGRSFMNDKCIFQ